MATVGFSAFDSAGLGAAATKIMHSEPMVSRREATQDRALQAQAYRRDLDDARARTAATEAEAERLRTDRLVSSAWQAHDRRVAT